MKKERILPIALLLLLFLSACSSQRIKKDDDVVPKSINININVGDTYVFGSYEQDNNTDNGPEPIEWNVISKKHNKIFLISKFSLDYKQYNTFDEKHYYEVSHETDWKSCTLRKWLNGTFIDNAFNLEEQKSILKTSVSNTVYSTEKWSVIKGTPTIDRVFLLSIEEVEKYFNTDESRMCRPTEYAKSKNSLTEIMEITTDIWWLRSPGVNPQTVTSVDSYGSFYSMCYADFGDVAVRPALWISLES